MKKRLTALLLVLSLVLSLGATVAFATDEDDVLDAPVVDAPVVDDPVVDDPVVDDPVVDDPDGDESQKEVSFADLTVEEQYALLMACTTQEEANALLAQLSDEETELLMQYASTVSQSEGATIELNVISNSRVAKLLPPVAATTVWRSMRSFSAVPQNVEEDENGLFLTKTADKIDGTDAYQITLEAFVTGKVKISSETKNIPSDIVLVLDVSGSMNDYITVGSKDDTAELDAVYGAAEGMYEYNSVANYYAPMRYSEGKWQYNGLFGWTDLGYSFFGGQSIRISKMNALKIAVQNFIDSVDENARLGTDGIAGTGDEVDHKISIVKFAGTKLSTVGNQTYDEDGDTYNYSQIVRNLTSVNGNASALKSDIVAINAGGATSADYGMEHAQTIINSITRESNRVVIMFTDGEPNHGSGFDEKVANSTIGTSKSIKAAGASVYTIGVLGDADDTVPMPSNASDLNKYMHYVSSNFKNANSLTDGGTATYPEDGSSFYLSAGNANEISGIFKQISDNIQSGGASITLGSTTKVKDVISPYFTMPTDTSSISVSTAKYLGYESDKTTRKFANADPLSNAAIEIDPKTREISVSNFDFSSDENCVTDTDNNGSVTYSGKKLIITFTVTPDSDFLGGDNVPTNGDAGVYKADDTLVEAVDSPKVSVPVTKITPDVQNLNVYLANSTDLTGLLKSIDSRINGTNNAFVTVTYTIKDGNTVVGTYTVPAGASTGSWSPATVSASLLEDKTYTVACEVKPATSAAATAQNSANVNVFKPELTYQDATIYLGNSAPDFNSLRVGDVVWKNGTTLSTKVNMTGTAPTLNITYDKSTAGLTACTDVNATVKIGGTDVTESVKFWNNGEERGMGKAEFTVHVLKPSFQTTDVTIYLHNSTKLDNRVTTTGWSCVSEHDGSVTVPAVQGDAPAITYSFQVNNTPVSNQTAYAPTECVNVAVTPKVGNETRNQENLNFDVHVLYPSFEVTVNDVWADYGVDVNLKDNCIAAPVITWNDKNSTHTPGQVEGTAPISASTAFTFTCEKVSGDGSLENGVYTTGVQDADFKVTGIAYQLNGKEYSWSVAVKDAEANAASHFTVHINHFDLVVNKTWTGDSIYRQDAIFTLTDTTANTSMKVVVRATKGTVTIKNLVCGKNYSVEEDGNWVWRFLCSEAQNVACGANPAHGITKTDPGVHTVTKSFTNTLKLLKWLDGSAYCNNNFADLNP